jgi:hypothetical protein
MRPFFCGGTNKVQLQNAIETQILDKNIGIKQIKKLIKFYALI